MTSESAPALLFRHEIRFGSTTLRITIEAIEDPPQPVTDADREQVPVSDDQFTTESEDVESGLGEKENVDDLTEDDKISELVVEDSTLGEPPFDAETKEIEHEDTEVDTSDLPPTPDVEPTDDDAGKLVPLTDDKTVASDDSDETDWGMTTAELGVALETAIQSYNNEVGHGPLVMRNIGDVDPTSTNTTNSSITEMQEENYDEADKINPLLAENDEDLDSIVVSDTISEVSVEEFVPSGDNIDKLDPDDPKTILTWNVSGLSEVVHRKQVWTRFADLVEGVKPDIVVLQNVKLCESQMIGYCPKVVEKGDGRAAKISYDQQFKDGQLIEELKRNIFKRYHLVHSLASWRIGGQLIFIKKRFTVGYMGITLICAVHHGEIRSQYEGEREVPPSVNGWDTANLKQKKQWHRDLAHLLYHLKDTKAVVLCGYLNWYVEPKSRHIFDSAPEDIDLSDSEKLKMESSPVLHDSGNTGFPGCRPADREGFRWILLAGRLVDSFRLLHPYRGKHKNPQNKKYTSLGLFHEFELTNCSLSRRQNTMRRQDQPDSRFAVYSYNGTQLVANYFMKNVSQCEIIGNTNDLSPSGWRHLPQLLVMRSPKGATTAA
ncbi:exonuclease III APE [Babesia ovata]|uniref:Exonuclease III APE n=1 Tax=Babesia ovata TaxID=189622 RepID=A0A2H6K8B9_9APIC|nr:exonuclease III APE [Babesia ovata]GBE59252.1 exonuclease III APE [Babesia ovata]